MTKRLFGIVFALLAGAKAFAQIDELIAALGDSLTYATAAFKTTRVINAHSLENTPAGVLDVKISHRFGRLNSGGYQAWGLDDAHIRIGLDYGVSNRLMVGLGRNSFEKTFDGFLKYKWLRQCSGSRNLPLTVVWLSTAAFRDQQWPAPDSLYRNKHRWAYTHQLILGRKFNNAFSLQFMPTLLHRNLVVEGAPNRLFSLGVAARHKITRRISLNVEYFYSPYLTAGFENPLSVGFDIETGGHVFQLHLTNSRSAIEKGVIGETTGTWAAGDIHFGFNISRVFTVVSPQKLTHFRNW